jgi:hypothetical protein
VRIAAPFNNTVSFKIPVMKKSLLGLLVLVAVNNACKKSGNAGTGGLGLNGSLNPYTVTATFYPAAIDYIRLPLNRYYIYKDSATAVKDSVVVTQSIIAVNYSAATSGFPGKPALYQDTYSLTLTNYPAPSGNLIWLKGFTNDEYTTGLVTANIAVTDSNINFSDTQHNLPVFWHPFTSSGVSITTSLTSLLVEGITYADVKKFSSNNGLVATDPNFIAISTYWVKGIGIIKREIKTAAAVKTYLLLRYG